MSCCLLIKFSTRCDACRAVPASSRIAIFMHAVRFKLLVHLCSILVHLLCILHEILAYRVYAHVLLSGAAFAAGLSLTWSSIKFAVAKAVHSCVDYQCSMECKISVVKSALL